MEVFEAIKNRRSIRRFRKQEIEKEKIEKILEAATYAPSSGNLQNWEFILVKDENSKKEIAKISLNQKFIEEADFLIIVCSNQEKISWYGERGKKLYAIQNCAAAIQNMLLAAHSLGIGSCWVGAFDDLALIKFLNLPNHILPQAILAFGYPAEKPKMPERIDWKKITFKEKYGRKI